MTLLDSVRAAWFALGDPPPGIVVAVSGGPDSVALARALLAVRPEPSVPVVLAHLNHQLRGSESDADESSVVRLAADLSGHGGVRLATHRLDVAALAGDENLEAAARRVRYDWLAEVARAHSLRHVATGHTADDQAETVLFRLLRGTGVEGLRGIAPERELGGVSVVRPMLDVRRAEVLAYLESLGQSARHDASNDDPRFTRNRIRHELLPLLARDYNPRVAEALARLARQADELFTEEERASAELLRRAESARAGSLVILDASVLGGSPARLVRAALRRVWARENWPMGRLGFDHWQRLGELAGAEGGACDLPDGISARRVGKVLQIGPNRARMKDV